jgi:hypothetical protein
MSAFDFAISAFEKAHCRFWIAMSAFDFAISAFEKAHSRFWIAISALDAAISALDVTSAATPVNEFRVTLTLVASVFAWWAMIFASMARSVA